MIGGARARRYDYVVDAIDNARAKAALIAYCRDHAMPLITIGGAGGQTDPTKIAVRDLCQDRAGTFAQAGAQAAAQAIRLSARREKQVQCRRRVFDGAAAVPGGGSGAARSTPTSAGITGINCAGFGSSVVVTASLRQTATSGAERKRRADLQEPLRSPRHSPGPLAAEDQHRRNAATGQRAVGPHVAGRSAAAGPQGSGPIQAVAAPPAVVKPGLTCLWQVSGRSDIGFEDWVRMDIWYVNASKPVDRCEIAGPHAADGDHLQGGLLMQLRLYPALFRDLDLLESGFAAILVFVTLPPGRSMPAESLLLTPRIGNQR